MKNQQYIELLGVAPGIQYQVQEVLNNQQYQLKSIQSLMNVDQTFETDLVNKKASGVIVNQTQHILYTNQFEYQSVHISGKDCFRFKKLYNGWDQGRNDTFDIILEARKGTPMPKGELISNDKDYYYVKQTVSKDHKDQMMAFGDISYKQPGEYTYIIRELKPKNLPIGVVFTPQTYKVVVTVSDQNQNGVLSVSSLMTCIMNKKGEQIKGQEVVDKVAIFENSFTTDQAVISFSGTKVFNQFFKNHDFYFKLTPKGHAPMPKNDIVSANQSHPHFEFGHIIFDQSDIGKTYEYTIEEVLDDKGTPLPKKSQKGITYDHTQYHVTLKVQSKDVSGVKAIDAQVTYAKNEKSVDKIVFTNSYQASGTYTFKGMKELIGRNFNSTDTFKFIVVGENNAPLPHDGEVIVSMKDATDMHVKEFEWGTVTFTKPGKYNYVFFEEHGSIPNMKYSEVKYNVTLNVVDNGDGTLSVINEDLKDIIFTNEYIMPIIPDGNDDSITPPNEEHKPPQSTPEGGQTILPTEPNHSTEVEKQPTVPQTNDQTMILPYFVMMFVSFSVIILLNNKKYSSR